MPALEPLRGLRVVAEPSALDAARWSGDRTPAGPFVGDVTVLRFAPDEAFAVGARHVDIDDEHAIVEDERGYVGAWCSIAEVGRYIEPKIEWLPGFDSLAQGSIAGVPAKLWMPSEGQALVVTAAPYRHELATRLGWSA